MPNTNQQKQTIHALSNQLAHTKNPIDKLFYRGVIALLKEDLDTAEATFLDVLTQDRTYADARSNLGVISLKRNHSQQAITYFSETLGFDETHENARNNLAATFIHHNRFENARIHYQILLKSYPKNPEYRYNAGVAEMALGHLKEACEHFNVILKQNPNHSASLTNLASIASRLNKTSDAIDYLKRAKAANPSDTSSAFMLDALTEEAPMRTASNDYTKNLFDNYALHYEKHMHDTLNYSVPQHIAKCLHQLILEPTPNTLDIGCGTGLTGIVLRELSLLLTGIDLSPNMLIEAEQKAIYDELFEVDAIQFLSQENNPFSLIVAADVLPYFSELDTLFKYIKKTLISSGLFVFTTEISDTTDWTLQKTARFAHHTDYITTLAKQHGFEILSQQSLTARKHHNEALHVKLYTLRNT
ncbi:MAG: tetratricopeptide repeat protein [Gammaproteobacteria bacterium]|nr:tetratricopeptide repeat protein [Gammaproteobacteria bacterium]